MSNKDERNQDRGEGKTFTDESTESELPRHAGRKHDFDEDTEDGFKLPKVTPEVTEDDDDDAKKKADSAFDDLEIVIDEDELQAESETSQPVGRKY